MNQRTDAFEASDEMPAQADVVVIGGGIAGVTTAFFLAEKGLSVVLCEKGYIGCEQSSRNWGWTRVMGRDPAEIPLSVESLKLWRGLNARIGGETGFRQAGIMYLCENDAEMAHYEAWGEHARNFQLDSRLVSGAEAAALAPGSSKAWKGGMYTASDGRAEPSKATPAIANAAKRLGATILTGCAVRGIETAGGRVSGVVTERGPIATDKVVLAAGAWSRLFCGNFGLDLPQLKLLGSVCRTEPMEGPPELAVGTSNFAFRKRLDGGYTISRRNASISQLTPDHFRLMFDFLPALKRDWRELRIRLGGRFLTEWNTPRSWALDRELPFEQVRVLDPAPDAALVQEGCDNTIAAFPAFAGLKIAESWGGLIDATPDGVPVISAVSSLPGLVISTGYSGHGFGIGPGAGRLTADIVTGSAPIVDPTPFRLERFARAATPAH